ncbi:MAG: hypothetical protein IBJ00_00970 [Alphaproteobacteria bacterium]|nr:hypothetical protein [Alphaproteobacteria bacterium]
MRKRFSLYILIFLYAPLLYASEERDRSFSRAHYACFKEALDYDFSDHNLLQQACSPRTLEFERLEFLGDRVLGFSVVNLLYLQYPSARLPQYTKYFEQLVSNSMLAKIYNSLNIPISLITCEAYKPPLNGQISKKTSSDIIEALIGAIYLDKGMEAAQACVQKLYSQFFDFNPSNQFIPSVPLLNRRQLNTDFTFLQKHISYNFNNILLLQTAFVHSSARGADFEKLAFFGSKLLAVVVAKHLFDINFIADEGTLTSAFITEIEVSKIQKVFEAWRLGQFLVRNEGGLSSLLQSNHTAPRIASHTLQALLGAIYFDADWLSAEKVTSRLLFSESPKGYSPQEIIRERLRARLRESTPAEKSTNLDLTNTKGCPVLGEKEVALPPISWPSEKVTSRRLFSETLKQTEHPKEEIIRERSRIRLRGQPLAEKSKGLDLTNTKEWPVLGEKEVTPPPISWPTSRNYKVAHRRVDKIKPPKTEEWPALRREQFTNLETSQRFNRRNSDLTK